MRTAQRADDTCSKARLEAYDRGQCTSRGQISEVYMGVHLETGIPVAMKKTARFGDLQEAVQKECEMEAGLLMALDHPHLIRYHEHFLHEGDLYLVMEPAMGGTLAQKVESARSLGSPMDEALLWRWLSDVSSALVYLHRRRVLHRDIKPSHVFLGQDGAAKLGDFGLSRELQTATQCALSCVGTPFYMSPEIVKGEGYAFASDVWSLGCTLYECAMFFSPFYRSDMDFMALGSAICSASYPPLPPDQWTQELITIVGETLEVLPGRRANAQRLLDVAARQLVCPRFQDFELVGMIGRGKFSDVHRALWRNEGDREVALKRIKICDMDAQARREVEAEVRMLRSLQRPTIISYLNSFMENNELVIVLELAAHGDLSNLLGNLKQDRRSLSELQIWACLFQVSDGLQHMHSLRVMHRDLKPANIFVCEKGVVKLGDLGLGRQFSSNTYVAHSVVGTPFYMSPEVITSCGGYAFESDIWSLGCILYELATLTSPFSGQGLSYYALGNCISRAEYPPLPGGTPQCVCDLCGKMIQVAQKARPCAREVCGEAESSMARCFCEEGAGSPLGQLEGDSLEKRLARAARVIGGVLPGASPSRPPRPHPSAAAQQPCGGQPGAHRHSGSRRQRDCGHSQPALDGRRHPAAPPQGAAERPPKGAVGCKAHGTSLRRTLSRGKALDADDPYSPTYPPRCSAGRSSSVPPLTLEPAAALPPQRRAPQSAQSARGLRPVPQAEVRAPLSARLERAPLSTPRAELAPLPPPERLAMSPLREAPQPPAGRRGGPPRHALQAPRGERAHGEAAPRVPQAPAPPAGGSSARGPSPRVARASVEASWRDAPVPRWSVDQVVGFLRDLELGALERRFRGDAVNGHMLLQLTQEDLQHELGLSKLQAWKVLNYLPASPGVSPQTANPPLPPLTLVTPRESGDRGPPLPPVVSPPPVPPRAGRHHGAFPPPLESLG